MKTVKILVLKEVLAFLQDFTKLTRWKTVEDLIANEIARLPQEITDNPTFYIDQETLAKYGLNKAPEVQETN